MKKIFCAISLMFLTQLYCQLNTPIIYPTPPSVYEFAKYGNFSVNEYKGLANISIPLYNIVVDDIQLPLELSYYSGGIRVCEEAGPVGLGWSMNLPTIIQYVKDKNDYGWGIKHQKLPPMVGSPTLPTEGQMPADMAPEASNNNPTWYSYTSSINYQNVPHYFIAARSMIVDDLSQYNESKYYTLHTDYNADSEPDIFSLNLSGTEIKFCRKQSQSLIAQENHTLALEVINGRTEYLVELLQLASPVDDHWLEGIKVTDPGGNQYFFKSIEFVKTDMSSSGHLQSSYSGDITVSHVNYKLTKVITSRGNEINLGYTRVNNVSDIRKYSTTYFKKTSGNSWDIDWGNLHPVNVYNDGYFTHDGTLTTDVNISNYNQSQNFNFLTSITTRSENITLTYSDRIDYKNMKRLDGIDIKNIFGNNLKKFIFSYDYFTSTDNLNAYTINQLNPEPDLNTRLCKRLKLLSVHEEGQNPYTFTYNGTTLPKKNSFSIDYWGLYNGNNNISFNPNLAHLGFTQYSDNSVNDFSASLAPSKACTLEKVTYPTKGYTTFEYELHSFDNLLYYMGNPTPLISTGAGLRIKKIKNYSDENILAGGNEYVYSGGKNISKRILAIATGESGSQCRFDGAFQYDASTIIQASIGGSYIATNILGKGDYIGYSNVTTIPIQANAGKTTKQFVNIESPVYNPQATPLYNPMYIININDKENGKILQEELFAENEPFPLKKTVYNYLNIGTDEQRYGLNFKGAGLLPQVSLPPGNPYCVCACMTITPRTLLTFYPILSSSSILLSKEVTDYYPSGIKKNLTYLTYDSKNNVVSTAMIANPGGTFHEEIINYTYTSNSTHQQKNILNFPANKIVKEFDRSKRNEIYTYEEAGNISRLKAVTLQPHSNPDPLYSSKITYDVFDSAQNIIQFHKENDINIVVIWGYNKTLPIAKIENILYSDIQSYIGALQAASDLDNESNLLTQLSNFRNLVKSLFPSSKITTYTHKPKVGPSTITDVRGNRISYIYDSANRLKEVRDYQGNLLNSNEYYFKQ